MIAIAVSVLFSGCATIFGKSVYPVSIGCNPRGATVSITDKKHREVYKGSAPVVVGLKSSAGFFSKAEYFVKISSPGYADRILPVNFKLNGWYFGNLLIGGVLGMLIIDPATGAMWKLATPDIYIDFEKSIPSAGTPTLQIIDIASVSQDMKQYLVRLR